MPLVPVVIVVLSLVAVLVIAAVATVRWRRRRRTVALAAERELLRAQRERDDSGIRQALLDALEKAEPRIPPGSGPVVLMLGVGAVEVGASAPGGVEVAARSGGPDAVGVPARVVAGAPLLVPAVDGVRVVGPPGLASIVAASYRRRLSGLGPSDGAGGYRIEVGHATGGGPSDRAAEVWIGPDGGCAARSPQQAGGRWVPLELRL